MLAFGVKWIKLLKVPDLIVLRSDSFTNSLSNILIYIAHDSKNRARQFNKTLQASLKELPNMPYKFRKSIYFEDEFELSQKHAWLAARHVFGSYLTPHFELHFLRTMSREPHKIYDKEGNVTREEPWIFRTRRGRQTR